jgi:LPPG:FO 2-phospho-L-lactate transferase
MNIVAFAGGVGGAKLADGLAQCLSAENLTIIVNTGDDFEHWGLKISPDLDTVCYTLANLANQETGWGRAGETWEIFETMRLLSGTDWFHIGDKDLATHLERTRRLKEGQTLSAIIRDFCHSWQIGPLILPMSDEPVATIVETLEMGELPFQEYFVHQRCLPTVKGFHFDGILHAAPAPGVLEAIHNAGAVVFCPSNPWVSIDPILALKGVLPALAGKKVIAVSPIIGGQTIKGPAAKMFTELGIQPSAFAVANHYAGKITGFVLDDQDAGLAGQIDSLGIQTLATNTLMNSRADRVRLGKDVLNFIQKD